MVPCVLVRAVEIRVVTSAARTGRPCKSEGRCEVGKARMGRPPKEVEDPGVEQVLRVQFAGKPEADVRSILLWVFESVDVADVTPAMAPSAGAWSLLSCVRKWPEFRQEFYRHMFPRLLPSRSQLETEARFKDSGHETIRELIERVAVAIGEGPAPVGAEGPPGEFEVSQ